RLAVGKEDRPLSSCADRIHTSRCQQNADYLACPGFERASNHWYVFGPTARRKRNTRGDAKNSSYRDESIGGDPRPTQLPSSSHLSFDRVRSRHRHRCVPPT